MLRDTQARSAQCTCLALRQAARHVTQFYDQHLMPTGLRITQFSILAELKLLGPMTINALAETMVMDRTTLGRNILPLQREGLIDISTGSSDRRSKELRLTVTGIEKVREARRSWAVAQRQFESAFGRARASDLRAELGAVAACDL